MIKFGWITLQITACETRIHQVTTLLHESEAENSKLTQLTDALKEEIRRNSRNVDREKHMENIEYIKNVILKVFFVLKLIYSFTIKFIL